MNGRFSSADNHSVEKTHPSFQKSEKYFLAYKVMAGLFDFFRKHEFAIVAISTSKIASWRKNYGGKFSRVVKKCRFFDGRKLHEVMLKLYITFPILFF